MVLSYKSSLNFYPDCDLPFICNIRYSNLSKKKLNKMLSEGIGSWKKLVTQNDLSLHIPFFDFRNISLYSLAF